MRLPVPIRPLLAAAALACAVAPMARAADKGFGFDAGKGWFDMASGAVLPDTPWRQGARGLGALLLLTPDADSLVRDWQGKTTQEAPVVNPQTRVRMGETLDGVVIYAGCAQGKPCAARIAFSFRAPDGSVQAFPAQALADGAAQRDGLLYLAIPHPRFVGEKDDPTGGYTLLATIHDPDSARTVTVSQPFELLP